MPEIMSYDFDQAVSRRGSNSSKWDSADDSVLPMWVADMDFQTAPAIISALQERVQHGIFGYVKVPPAYFDAVTAWHARRHGFFFQKEWLLYTTGVVPALSAIIKALTEPGDKVIVQTPVYNCFFSSIRNQGCETLAVDLHYEDGRYSMDFVELEKQASDPGVKLLLLCNPHNPVGRAWTAEELTRLGEICLRNDVIVVSDEIHCDLVHAGHRHVPFGSISEAFLRNSVTCSSPTKTFNLAGLHVANILAADEGMRRRIDKVLNIHEVCELNPFGVVALIAAYNESEDWLDGLLRYLGENYAYVLGYLERHLPAIRVLPLEATYLVWIDCSAYQLPVAQLAAFLLTDEKLWVNEGTMYGQSGEGFIRMNIACPRGVLTEGLRRLKDAFIDGRVAEHLPQR
jgi:cystathionine beta-lyase